MTPTASAAPWHLRASDCAARWLKESLPARSDLVPFYLASVVLVDTLMLFLIATASVGSGRAWLLLSGSGSPTAGDHSWPIAAVLGGLAIAGYLLLPTMIGLMVVAGSEQLARHRRTAKGELQQEIDTLVDLYNCTEDQTLDQTHGGPARSAESANSTTLS